MEVKIKMTPDATGNGGKIRVQLEYDVTPEGPESVMRTISDMLSVAIPNQKDRERFVEALMEEAKRARMVTIQ